MEYYSERFKKLQTVKLINIIRHPENYKPEAVKAAETELASREISQLEQQSIMESNDEESFRRTLNFKFLKEKVNSIISPKLNEVNPFESC